MAEWVQKGNLKGPQGDPGQDAQLPAGGTDGQVLTKTSGGEAWADVPQPDMTGVVKISNDYLEHEDQRIAQIHVSGVSDADTIIGSTAPGSSIITSMGQSSAQVVASNGNDIAALLVTTAGAFLKIGSKSVNSITDAIADSPDGDALVTDKAVADYVDAHGVTTPVPIDKGGTGATTAEGAALMVFAHAPEASPTQAGVVKTLSDQDFCEYMGIDYNPYDWS